jgi:ABC-type dipeptide/oligopeptide/nickel transport system permease subunit
MKFDREATMVMETVTRNRPSTARIFLRQRLVFVGGVIVILLGLAAIAAPTLTRMGWLHSSTNQDPAGLDQDGMPVGPSHAFPLGTDQMGRDIFARVIYGARVSLPIGIAAMLTATLIGVAIGLLAGFRGGLLDMVLLRFTDMNLALPAILLAIAFAAVMDGKVVHLHPAALHWHFLDVRLERGMVSLFLIIGFVSWPGMVRVVRGKVLEVKEHQFVQAARALGASDTRLIWRHILPNISPTIIVLAAMNTAYAILLEAGLGYLGIGVPEPAATWGSMISDGQPYFVVAPHIVIVPGVAIVVTVLGLNLVAQGLQEAMDTKRL